MKAIRKRRPKSDAELLDHATNNLLKGLKCDMLTRDGRIDRVKLSIEGYGNRLLNMLEHAQ